LLQAIEKSPVPLKSEQQAPLELAGSHRRWHEASSQQGKVLVSPGPFFFK
jgi:hypothetical protein